MAAYNSVGISSAIFVITLIHLILTFVSVLQFPRIFFDSVAFQGAPVCDVVLSVANLQLTHITAHHQEAFKQTARHFYQP